MRSGRPSGVPDGTWGILQPRPGTIPSSEGKGLAAAATTRRGDIAGGDQAARLHLYAATVFMLVAGMLTGLAFLKLRYPTFLADVPAWSYGRLRPIALNAALFGWLTLGHVGAIYYLLPRLTGARLWGERWAVLNLAGSIVIYVAALVSLAFGQTQGLALLEFPLWADLLVLATLAVPAVVVVRTLQDRREESLYVSLWYAVAGIFWILLLYMVGNVPGLGGVSSALQASFFGAGVISLWVVGVGTGTTYYLLPKETGNPLYSRQLALVGFWSLAFTAVWVGPARLIHGPVPDWSETIAVVLSLALVVPALAVVTNFAGTLQGAWESARTSLPVRFAIGGSVAYLLLAILGGISAFRWTAATVGLTVWGDGMLVATLFGLAGLWYAAFVYHALPRMVGRRVFSHDIGVLHFRLTVLGVGGLALFLWIAGLVYGYGFAGNVTSGVAGNAGVGFLDTLRAGTVLYTLSALSALLMVLGQVAFGYNIWRTLTSGRAAPREVLQPVGVGDE